MAANARVLGYRGSQVLEFIRATIDADGQAPSYTMICDHLGLASRGKVNDIVRRLESRGLVKRVGTGRVRRLRLPART